MVWEIVPTLRDKPIHSQRNSLILARDIRKRMARQTISAANPGPTKRHSLKATPANNGSPTSPVGTTARDL
jgi:hypothetical protein